MSAAPSPQTTSMELMVPFHLKRTELMTTVHARFARARKDVLNWLGYPSKLT